MTNNAPQPTSPALKSEDSSVNNAAEGNLTGKPTLWGQAPAGLGMRFASVPPGELPEFFKLPSPRERCPFTGASRSWILDMEKAGLVKIVRIRRPGKMRGACFVQVASLMALLRSGIEGGAK